LLRQLFELLHFELPVLFLRPKEAGCGWLSAFGRRDCAKSREALHIGITELHIVGGLHPSLPFSYYTDMLKALRALDPKIQLKCFTAIEILHLAWLAKKSGLDTLRGVKAGLDSLTAAARRFFAKRFARRCKGKESAEEYLTFITWHKWAAEALARCCLGMLSR
jgi:aminodeoxyfutalosine synthase